MVHSTKAQGRTEERRGATHDRARPHRRVDAPQAEQGTRAERSHRHRRPRRSAGPDHSFAREGARRQADVGLLLRRQQGRAPRPARRLVFEEIELPDPEGDWREEMRRRAVSARARLKQHRWAIGLLESRTSPGPATLRHHDTVLACLRHAGFSLELTAHAYALIDSYVYGFALQEASLPFEGPEALREVAEPIMALMAAGAYPTMVEMATTTTCSPATTSATSSSSVSSSSSTGSNGAVRGTDRRTGARPATARPSPPRGGQRS